MHHTAYVRPGAIQPHVEIDGRVDCARTVNDVKFVVDQADILVPDLAESGAHARREKAARFIIGAHSDLPGDVFPMPIGAENLAGKRQFFPNRKGLLRLPGRLLVELFVDFCFVFSGHVHASYRGVMVFRKPLCHPGWSSRPGLRRSHCPVFPVYSGRARPCWLFCRLRYSPRCPGCY